MGETDKNQASTVASCPYLTTCAIIQSEEENQLTDLAGRFKNNYCFRNHKDCARRWIKDFLGIKEVPELMMPQQHDWAKQILVDAGVGQAALHEQYGTSLTEFDSEQ